MPTKTRLNCQHCGHAFEAEPEGNALHRGREYECPSCAELTFRCQDCDTLFTRYSALRSHASDSPCTAARTIQESSDSENEASQGDEPADSQGPPDAEPDSDTPAESTEEPEEEDEGGDVEVLQGALLAVVGGGIIIIIGGGVESALLKIGLLGIGTWLVPVGLVIGVFEVRRFVVGAPGRTTGGAESDPSAVGVLASGMADAGMALFFAVLAGVLAVLTSGGASFGFTLWAILGVGVFGLRFVESFTDMASHSFWSWLQN